MRPQRAGPGTSNYTPGKLDAGKTLPTPQTQGTRVQTAGPGTSGYVPGKLDMGKAMPTPQTQGTRVQGVGPGTSGYVPGALDMGKTMPTPETQGTRVQAAGPGSTGYDPQRQDAGKYLPANGGNPGFVRAGTCLTLNQRSFPHHKQLTSRSSFRLPAGSTASGPGTQNHQAPSYTPGWATNVSRP